MASPKKKAITMKLVYEAQKGVKPTEIVHMTRQMLFMKRASTDGKSAT